MDDVPNRDQLWDGLCQHIQAIVDCVHHHDLASIENLVSPLPSNYPLHSLKSNHETVSTVLVIPRAFDHHALATSNGLHAGYFGSGGQLRRKSTRPSSVLSLPLIYYNGLTPLAYER